MEKSIPLLFSIFLVIGCGTHAPKPEVISCGYVQMDSDFIPDEIPLKSASTASLQDLALTFPVYEMGAEETKRIILSGGFPVRQSASSWLLEGDGAQTCIQLIRLSPANTLSLKVVLRVGPRFNGMTEDKFVYEYEFVREGNGWRKLSSRKSTDSPLLKN